MIWNVIDKIAIYKLKKPTCMYTFYHITVTNRLQQHIKGSMQSTVADNVSIETEQPLW